jgi:TolA-binding protein
MSRSVKLVLYVICVIGIVVFGVLMKRSYRQATEASEQRKERINRVAGNENTNHVTVTNGADIANANTAEITNAVVATANTSVTNPVEPSTNLTEATNLADSKRDADPDIPQVSGVTTRSYTRMITYGLGLLVFFLGLAALIGYDVAQFLGTRAQETLFNDNGQPIDPEYEKAEQMWANGQYLESVRAMRSYLENHPREQYVALRIAEIYEENLNNPLAAALEYEEVLKKKLPAERWGWAAIHLANIYSGKLNQSEKAVALLRRIDAEYGRTAAANKARERLLQIDPDFVPASQPSIAAEETESTERQPPPSNLPPGFRPKA